MNKMHSAMEQSLTEHYPFSFPELPYAYGALCPVLNSATLHYHHDRHLKTYTEQLNALIRTLPGLWDLTLSQLLSNPMQLPPAQRTAILRSAGGVLNHRLYFCALSPHRLHSSAALQQAIMVSFGSQDALLDKMKQTGLSVFGSGWAWLVKDRSGGLNVISTANQNCPITRGLQPLLSLDVWEHAYYLWYQNRRDEYISNWSTMINWDFVERLFLAL